MNKQGTMLKVAAMLVAIPRYVGLMLFITGFRFEGVPLVALHIAEGVAGLSLAVLEGFAIAYIFSKFPLIQSVAQKWLLSTLVSILLIMLPLCVAPYMLELYDGTKLFVELDSLLLKFTWVTATVAMPMLIIAGVALVEQNSTDYKLLKQLHKPHAATTTATKEQAATTTTTTVATIAATNTQVEPSSFTCACGSSFSSKQALGGHVRTCKEAQNAKAKTNE